MPIYEYHCKKCDQGFEYLVFGSDEPKNCPSCNSRKVGRIMSACGFKTGGSSSEPAGSSASSSSSCGGCSASSCSGCSS
jgi:putative FmdB family regulatory protein